MSTRNFPGGKGWKGGWCLRLTTSLPCICWLSRKCGSPTSHSPMAWHKKGSVTLLLKGTSIHSACFCVSRTLVSKKRCFTRLQLDVIWITVAWTHQDITHTTAIPQLEAMEMKCQCKGKSTNCGCNGTTVLQISWSDHIVLQNCNLHPPLTGEVRFLTVFTPTAPLCVGDVSFLMEVSWNEFSEQM
jgi:hypothetical protein